MADDQTVVSQFPPPPPFFRQYASADAGPPPPAPVDGAYSMFGRMYTTENIMPTLEEAGRQQLFPARDMRPRAELKKLSRSLMAKFLELLDLLLAAPSRSTPAAAVSSSSDEQQQHQLQAEQPGQQQHEQQERCAGEIELLLVNVHHLLNAVYRPHQARHSLLAMLDAQLAARRRLLHRLDLSIRQSQAIVRDAGALLRAAAASPPQLLPPPAPPAMSIVGEPGIKQPQQQQQQPEEQQQRQQRQVALMRAALDSLLLAPAPTPNVDRSS